METLRNALITSSCKYSKEHKEILKFIKNIDSFLRCPKNYSEGEKRIKKSIDYTLIAKPISSVITNYEPITADPIRNDYDDFKLFYYCLYLLCFDGSEASCKAMDDITDKAILNKNPNLKALRYYFSLFKETKAIKPLYEKVETYFNSISHLVESNIWAKDIGLIVPEKSWFIEFTLGTDSTPYIAPSLEKGIIIKVSVTGKPKGNGASWAIDINNKEGTIYGNYGMYYDGTDVYEIVIDRKENVSTNKAIITTVELTVKPSLLNFHSLLDELEQILKIKFVRKMRFSYFTKGIKNKKAVDKWLTMSKIKQ